MSSQIVGGGDTAVKNEVQEENKGSGGNHLINKTTKFIHQLISKETLIVLERNQASDPSQAPGSDMCFIMTVNQILSAAIIGCHF